MTWRTIIARYVSGCPNCGGPITQDRLEAGLPCRACLPDNVAQELRRVKDRELMIERVARYLEEHSRLSGYWYIYSTISSVRRFAEAFRKMTGKDLWSAQYTWALRLLRGESIAIVAPTGVGKTTLLIAYSLYRALQGSRIYYLLPTENLVIQVMDKLSSLSKKLDKEIRVASYYSSMPGRLKGEALSLIKSGSYDILVTTTSFLSRKWSLVKDNVFETIIVDDVDAVLKNSKNVDRILSLLGFSEEEIKLAHRLVKLKLEAAILKTSGRLKRYEERLLEIKELEARLSSLLKTNVRGQLVIASATGRAYGLKPKIFRELLGFEIGRVHDYTRNIINLYRLTDDVISDALAIVEKLGPGGLIYVSKRYGKGLARELVKLLRERGIKAGLALSGYRVLDKFARGEYDVLIGVANYYGVIVRGIDMPERVLYTLFVGSPAQKIMLEKALLSPYRLVKIAMGVGVNVTNIVKALSGITPNEASLLRIALERNEKLDGRLGLLLEQLRSLYATTLETIMDVLLKEKRLVTPAGLVVDEGGTAYLLVPDAPTYVQASGRASRMFNGGMTLGLSIVIEEDRDLLWLLSEKLKAYLDAIDFKSINDVSIEELAEKARKSRGGGYSKKANIETSLIVVESPTKAKTIARFFGSPVKRRIGRLIAYETTFYNPLTNTIHIATIAASRGHLFDLTIDDVGVHGVELDKETITPVYASIKECLSCGTQFASSSNTCPRCGSTNVVSKEGIVEALRKLALESSTVYIATDPDVEGEKIAYDIYLMLKPYARRILRIYMHEITKNELYQALASATSIDYKKVLAQIVRRIEDRWIGFGLSSILWREYGKTWLGAGRVQTPVLGWIIDRYDQWRSNLSYKVVILLPGKIRIVLYFGERRKAEEIADKVSREGLKVIAREDEAIELNPLPPYTTESLIYDASILLGYTSAKTMRLAQDLFENGLITYHRTDSIHVSSQGINIAKRYLEEQGLLELVNPRSWGPKGHHEAIRPTKPLDAATLRRKVATNEIKVSSRLTEAHYRLYDLIFRRFISSQMKPSVLVRTRLYLGLEPTKAVVKLEAFSRESKPGFAMLSPNIRIVKEIQHIKPGSSLKPEKVYVNRGSKVALYTHGDIVYMMKERGIGRPSTYTRTIEALLRHGYVIESKYRKYLIPTKLGRKVYGFLTSSFPSLISEERTKKLYEKLEMIERGDYNPVHAISDLYKELEEILELSGIYASESLEQHAGKAGLSSN
ncbi:MAG: reverse gyrase [Pyrodictiaceae archaeon]